MNSIIIRATEYNDAYFYDKHQEFTEKFNKEITALNQLNADPPFTRKQLDEFGEIAKRLYEIVEHSIRLLIRESFFERYKNQIIDETLWKEISETLHDNLKSGTPNARKKLDIKSKNPEKFVIGLPKLVIMMAKFCSPSISYKNEKYLDGIPACVITKSELDMERIIDKQNNLFNYTKHDPEDIEDMEDYLYTLRSVVTEIEKYVGIFLSNGSTVKTFQVTAENDEHYIYDQLRRKNSYSKLTRILVTDRLDDLSEKEQRVFKKMNWDIIVDLDSRSSVDGLESMILPSITPTAVICLPGSGRYNFKPFSDLYWFRFYRDDGTNLNLRLVNSYVSDFKRFLEGYKENGGRELLVVTSISDKKNSPILLELSKMICDMTYPPSEEIPDFGIQKNLQFCSLNNQSCYPPSGYDEFISIFKSFDITMHQLLETLSKDYPKGINEQQKVNVDRNGHVKVLETPAYHCFDIIYADIERMQELSHDEEALDPRIFYLAKAPISWYSISHQQHIVTSALKMNIETLSKEDGDIIHSNYLLPYDPGVGGTTALRTIAFHMSQRMPSVILKQYVKSETWKDCKQLSRETGSPIFIAVDENLINIEEFREFCESLQQNHVKHIAVYALRFTQSKRPDPKFKILNKLIGMDSMDAQMLIDRLKSMICKNETLTDREKEERCKSVENAVEEGKPNYPFILCMYAFEKEFKGTRPYIRHFLEGKCKLTEMQKKILLWIAIITVHTPYSLDAGLFAAGEVFFAGSANDVAEHLLRFDNQKGQTRVRFIHTLLAGEVICQLLFPNRETSYTIADFHKEICKALREFIKYVANLGSACSINLKVNTLADLFILKEPFDYEHETASLSPLMTTLYEGSFSFMDYNGNFSLVDKKQRIFELRSILETLVEHFPDSPHFHAHLGRFLAYMDNQDNRFELATEQADKAIELQADDCILYHIRANCRRKMLSSKTDAYLKGMGYKEVSPEELLQQENDILEIAKLASEDFEISRQNENSAGYICDVHMCITMVDFCRNAHHVDYQTIAVAEPIKNPIVAAYSEYYSRAIELFTEVDEMDQISERSELRFNIQKVKARILEIRNKLKDTLSFWEEYISHTGNPQDRYRAIRFCINSQKKNNSFEGIQDANALEKLINYAEILLDQTDRPSAGDLAHWFAMKVCYSRMTAGVKDRIMLEEMMINLSRWETGILNSHVSAKKLITMFCFIVASIQVLQGDSRGISIVKKHTAADDYIPRYYLRDGKYTYPILGDLYPYHENEAREKHKKISGTLILHADGSYRIDAQGIIVYCGMNRQEKIRESNVNQNVEFCMLFTSQDARALFNSVTLKKKSNNFRPKLGLGSCVTCEVIGILPDQYYDGEEYIYVFVSFNDAYNTYGMLKCLKNEELPQLKQKLELYIASEEKKRFFIKSINLSTECWIMEK